MTEFPTNPIPLEPNPDSNRLSNFILFVSILGVSGRWSEYFIKLRDNMGIIKCLSCHMCHPDQDIEHF